MEAFKQKGSAGFWKFHDKLFESQSKPDALKRPGLEKLAGELGLDMAKFKQALDNNTHKAAVDADAALGKQLGVTGTPGFFVNGHFLKGAQPVAKFDPLIQEALASGSAAAPAP